MRTFEQIWANRRRLIVWLANRTLKGFGDEYLFRSLVSAGMVALWESLLRTGESEESWPIAWRRIQWAMLDELRFVNHAKIPCADWAVKECATTDRTPEDEFFEANLLAWLRDKITQLPCRQRFALLVSMTDRTDIQASEDAGVKAKTVCVWRGEAIGILRGMAEPPPSAPSRRELDMHEIVEAARAAFAPIAREWSGKRMPPSELGFVTTVAKIMRGNKATAEYLGLSLPEVKSRYDAAKRNKRVYSAAVALTCSLRGMRVDSVASRAPLAESRGCGTVGR